MKKKLLIVLLVLGLVACLLVACNSSTNYDGMTKITYELEGGEYKNCNLPFYQYYDFKDGTTNLIRDPLVLSRKDVKRDGYTFLGWFKTRTENDGKVTYSDLWDFATDKVGTDGVTLYAGWKRNVVYLYNVCFVDEGGQTQILNTYEVSEGDEFDDYEYYANKRDGYTALVFADDETGLVDEGYYLDPDCTTAVKGFKHPGGEEDNAVNVYVKYIEGEFELVRTANDLIGAKSSNIYLMNDIDMGGKTLSFESYKGIFEGNDHVVSNFVVPYNAGKDDLKGDYEVHASLFGQLEDATIRNITFANAKLTIEAGISTIKKIYFAPLCMSATNSTVENVSIELSYKIVSWPKRNDGTTFDAVNDFEIFEDGYKTSDNSTINVKVALSEEK